MASVEESIEVDVPVRTAYDQWTQFQEFPQFMEGVEEVRQLDDTHLHWRTKIAGTEKSFRAKVTEQIPDERIAWTSEEGARQAGVVTFHRLDEQRTRIMLQLDAEPEGLVEKAGDALGLLERRVTADLENFKRLIESRGEESGAWRGEVGTTAAAEPAVGGQAGPSAIEEPAVHREIGTTGPAEPAAGGEAGTTGPAEPAAGGEAGTTGPAEPAAGGEAGTTGAAEPAAGGEAGTTTIDKSAVHDEAGTTGGAEPTPPGQTGPTALEEPMMSHIEIAPHEHVLDETPLEVARWNLEELSFPATKEQVLETLQHQGAPQEAVEKIRSKEHPKYSSPNEVMTYLREL